MSQKQAENKAFQYHCSGFHCAEAVSRAILELYSNGDGDLDNIPRAATAFGGGMGKTHEEACGALSGGMLALGVLLGRNEPGADWQEVSDAAAEFRQRFAEEFGSTKCWNILESFGEQSNMMKCKGLSGRAAGILAAILDDKQAK